MLARIAQALGTSLVDVVRTPASPPTSAPSLLTLDDIARAIVDLPPSVGSKIEAAQSATLLHAMEVADHNQSAAARLLGMERKAFVRKLGKARRERRHG